MLDYYSFVTEPYLQALATHTHDIRRSKREASLASLSAWLKSTFLIDDGSLLQGIRSA